MATDDKFTDSIIDSSLEALEGEHGWDKNLINKILDLYNSGSLTNLKLLSDAFGEISTTKEEDDID